MNKAQFRAWAVHLYTAIGGVVGMFALFAAADGRVRDAFLLLVVSMVIDATDGVLARRAQVSKVLPYFSGANMDNVIDTLTFVWVPVFIMWSEKLLPHPAWTIIPIIAALYAYGQVEMKTEDDFFLGFPSYWSTIALYMYWLQLPPVVMVLLVVIPGILSFIPTRYLYPSKNQVYWRTSWILGAIWFFMVLALLTQENPDKKLIWLSTFYPFYYLALSFYVDFKIRFTKKATM